MIGQTNANSSKINGTIKEYVVNTGNTIAKGDFVSIVSSGSISVSSPSTLVSGALTGENTLTINISDNKFLIIYNKNDSKLYAKVVNYTTTFDNNAETNIFNGLCTSLHAEKMSNGDIILSFITNVNNCRMCKLHINGNSVEVSIVATTILNETASYFSFALLTDTLAVATKYYASGHLLRRAVIVSISESSISILNNATDNISYLYPDGNYIFKIDDTKACLVIGERVNYYNGAYTITPNGSSNPTIIETVYQNRYIQSSQQHLSVFNGCRLNNKYVAIVVGSSARGPYPYMSFICELTNNEVGISFPMKLNDDSLAVSGLTTVSITSISLMDNDLLLIGYKHSSNSYGRLCVFDLKNNGIFDAITFNDTNTDKFSVARLNSTQGIVFYHNAFTANGDVRIVTLPTTYVKAYDGTGILGIAKSGGSAGETIKVYVP